VADGDKARFEVELVEKIRGPARRASAGMGKLVKDLEKMRRAALSKTVETTKEMATLGVIAAGAIGAAAIAMAVNFADFAQRSTMGLQQLAKHGASAGKLFDHVRNEAETLGLDVKDTTKEFIKFLALQFDPKQATDLIRMGADLKAFGTTAEGVSRVFSQLGQIQAKGKLQGEELIVLAENGISTQLVYEQLAKTLGKTKEEILKMQQAGQLTSDIALPAIQEAVKTKLNITNLGDAGRKVTENTLGGMMDRLKAQAQNALTDVGLALEGPLSEALRPIAKELGAFIKDPENIRALSDALLGVVDGFKAAVPFVKEFFKSFGQGFMEAAPEVFRAMGDALGFMSGNSKDLMNNTKFLARTLGQVVAFGLAVAGVLGGLVHAALVSVSVVVQAAIGIWDGLIATIGEAIIFFGDLFTELGNRITAAKGWPETMFEIGKAIVEGLARGINALVNLPFVAIEKIATGIRDRLTSMLKIGSPSKVFMELGGEVTAGFALGLDPLSSTLRKAVPANMNDVSIAMPAPGELGPVSSRFADPPNFGDGTAGGGFGGTVPAFAPVFHITQQPGQSAKELADEIAAMERRAMDDYMEEIAAIVGAA
jgi:tape measure domain-containing protein